MNAAHGQSRKLYLQQRFNLITIADIFVVICLEIAVAISRLSLSNPSLPHKAATDQQSASARLENGTLYVSDCELINQHNGEIQIGEHNKITQRFAADQVKEIIYTAGNGGSSVNLSIGEVGHQNTIKHVSMQGGAGKDNFTVKTKSDFSGVKFDIDGGKGENLISYHASVAEHDNSFHLSNAAINLENLIHSKFVIENPSGVRASTSECVNTSQINIIDNDGDQADEYHIAGPLTVNIKSSGNSTIDSTQNAKLTIDSSAPDSEYVYSGFARFVGEHPAPIGKPLDILAVAHDDYPDLQKKNTDANGKIDFGTSQQESVANILAAANGAPIGKLMLNSHSIPGTVAFYGKDQEALTADTLNIPAWSSLRGKFGLDGHIELGGCYVASGAEGEALLQKLATATGVPVSAGITVQDIDPGIDGTSVTAYPDGRITAESKPISSFFMQLRHWDWNGNQVAPSVEVHQSWWQKLFD